MEDEFRILLATVYGEAAALSPSSWRAVTSVILNRVGKREWKRLDSVLKVIVRSGFDAFKFRNSPYLEAFRHFGLGHPPRHARLEALYNTVYPLYMRTEAAIPDIVLYYSPRAQAQLHKSNPRLYPPAPRWDFKRLDQVAIPGTEQDDILFFRYKAAAA